jgi:hypothetical protein
VTSGAAVIERHKLILARSRLTYAPHYEAWMGGGSGGDCGSRMRLQRTLRRGGTLRRGHENAGGTNLLASLDLGFEMHSTDVICYPTALEGSWDFISHQQPIAGSSTPPGAVVDLYATSTTRDC